MTVSVIIPVFNRSRVVGRAISSVLNQSYQDFELIVVDDCSTDDSREVVNSFTDNRVKLIPVERNKGAPHCRNLGAKNARGEYLAFLDSDDEWFQDKLDSQLPLTGQGTVLVGCGYYQCDRSGKPIAKIMNKKLCGKDILEGDYLGGNSGPLIRKAAFFDQGGYDENLPARQDWDLWIRLQDEGLIACCEGFGYKYFTGESDQISKGIARKLEGTLTVYNKHRYKFEKNKVAHCRVSSLICQMKGINNDVVEAEYINNIIKQANLKNLVIYMGYKMLNKNFAKIQIAISKLLHLDFGKKYIEM